MSVRKCSKCHETKDYKYFSKDGIKNGKQLYKHFCSDCGKKMYASRSPEKIEKSKKTAIKWREKNKEKIKEVRKKYVEKNKEKIILWHRNNRLKNLEKFKEYRKKYYDKNKELLNDNMKQYNKSKKDGYHYVYYLPEEHYVGVTDNVKYRMYSHKSNFSRHTNDVEIVHKTPCRKEAELVESKLHSIGYCG